MNKPIMGIICWTMLLMAAAETWADGRIVTDMTGRKINLPATVERVICSGPGSLRLLTYLEAQDKIVAVDDMEKRRPQFDARPYALANPQFKTYPVFGEFRGYDHPELIMTLNPPPQAILKTYAAMGHDPVELQQKTGIPVVVLEYGDLDEHRQTLYQALRIIGQVVHREQRAEEIIAFFETSIADLNERTRYVPDSKRPSCFVGGIAFKGPHGLQSTEPGYPPFVFIGVRNLAFDQSMQAKTLRCSNVAKEKIVEWDPDFLFLDLSTLQMGSAAGALFELKNDSAYQILTAAKEGRVYGLLPYNWYTQNFGSILANAYYIGKLLYPERFQDIDPVMKANQIYTFLVGKPVFDQMSQAFGMLVFKPIPIN